ncbi:STM2901 family protein [Burkholderia ubonensis]|uniref:STM2901 family protein n=1 Tax=Burkholderia ubonensis TaxID=101571 RepID=UPI0009B407B0
MSDNRYTYGIHRNLTPADLFVYVAIDEIQKQLGFSDLAGAAAILLGQNDVPVSGKLGGAVPGTSVISMISMAARNMLPYNVRIRLPTITKAGVGGLRIATTRNLGAFVGRAIPVVGVVVVSVDVFLIMRNTVASYNRIVKPGDRVL